MTFWGITRLEEEGQDDEVPLVEAQAEGEATRAESRHLMILRFGHSCIAPGDPAALAEKQQLVIETHRARGALASLVSVPASLAMDPGLEPRLRAFLSTAQKAKARIAFDFGRAGAPRWLDDFESRVFDPLWFREQAPVAGIWKIHGWHPERWVRLYPESDLRLLVKLARRHRPSAVILAHSQRLAQWRRIQELLAQG